MASLTGNRVPLITGALAVLLVAASVWPTATPEGAAIHAERTREEALEFYRGHRAVTLTAGDRILIGSEYADYIDGRRTDGAAGRPSAAARARSQAQFDALADEAREARSEVSRAWRFAVNPGDPVSSKFFAYAFFHNEAFAFALSLAFLVVAGRVSKRRGDRSSLRSSVFPRFSYRPSPRRGSRPRAIRRWRG